MNVKCKWELMKIEEMKLKRLKKEVQLSEIELKILLARGINTAKKIEKFLKAQEMPVEWDRTLKDTKKAANIIVEAVKKQEQIVVYGDYDSDGINGTAVAVKLLRGMGGKVDYYINDRVKEGYGMCETGLKKILKKHPDTKLLITVDNGINCIEHIRFLKNMSVRVIITDHHEVPKEMPQADAVVDPKRPDDPFKFKELCGTAVIWRVMAYIYHTYGYNLELLYTSLDMVALATITDVVTLQEENRWFVTQGLKLMNEKPSYLFQTMKKVMKINGEVKSGTLGFQYGPLVNAVGRLEKDVNEVVEVFLSEDQVFIMNKIEVYKKLNEERKRITLEQVEKVYSQVDLSQKAIVVYDEHLGEGIIGLVAGNLKETYNRPTIVFTKGEDGNLKGSARSIEAFPVKEKLDGLKDLLLGYGGHMLAAGLGVTQDNYQQFKQQFIALANQKLTEEDIEKKYEYITCLEEGEINNQIYDAINRLEPYGTGFEAPYFKFEGLEIKECRAMGKPDPIHIRLTTQQNTTILGWRLLDKYEKMSPKKTREVLGTIEKNEFRGKVSYQIAILNDNLR